MKFSKFLLPVIFAGILLYGQEIDEIINEEDTADSVETRQSFAEQEKESGVKQKILLKDTLSLEYQAKKVKNHKYIVVSAVMTMLFAGVCMGSVSALNPE